MLHIVNGEKRNASAIASFQDNIAELSKRYEGTLYYGFPLSEIDNSRIIVDLLIVTKTKGVLAINFASANAEEDVSEMDRIYLLLRALLEKNSRLRKRTDLAIDVNVKNYALIEGDIPDEYKTDYVHENNFVEYYDQLTGFEERYYEALNESLDKVVSAKPKKVRNTIKKAESLGAKIKEIELEVANMDRWQRTAAYEIPNKPQRIRGLAGSGKTVVLALKAAYLHFLQPEAEIAVTFYSRTLYQQFYTLISDFYQQFSPQVKVDFEKVHVLHAWGTLDEPGIYSIVASRLKTDIFSYKQAVSTYGSNDSFSGICNNLLTICNMRNIENIPLFDYILIDEAQDFPPSFFRLAYKLFNSQQKKIVYAYDELQTLNKSSMPSIEEMFGVDGNNDALVQINNSQDPSEPRTDIILPICYRNTKWALTIAHALGFGVYRNETEPLVQFFQDLNVWEEIGYEKVIGELEFNRSVSLQRKLSATPSYFERLLTPQDAVQFQDAFDSKDQEYLWVAQQIKKNIVEDELDPDDILVIFPDSLNSYKNYDKLYNYLEMAGINSIMPGKNVNRDTFTMKGNITCTHIFRAKGNEKPMVYLVDGEYGARNTDLISVRNTLFTAITRSRAWIRVSGTGSGMTQIKEEVEKCISEEYQLKINIPSREKIKELNLLNRDASLEEKKRINTAAKVTNELIEMIRKGIISADSLPQLKDLMSLLDKSSEE